MAWRSYLIAVTDNTVPSDSFFIAVRFTDAAQNNKTIDKQYKIMAGTPQADVRAMVRADVVALNSMEVTRGNLIGLVGGELT